MSYLEQQVEKRIVDILQAAIGTLGTVTGFHQPVDDGSVKASAVTGTFVKASIRSNETFGSARCTLPVLIMVRTTASEDPACSLLPAITEKVLATLTGWHKDADAMSAELSEPSVFRADALMFTDGGEPDFDEDKMIWFVPILINIKGVTL